MVHKNEFIYRNRKIKRDFLTHICNIKILRWLGLWLYILCGVFGGFNQSNWLYLCSSKSSWRPCLWLYTRTVLGHHLPKITLTLNLFQICDHTLIFLAFWMHQMVADITRCLLVNCRKVCQRGIAVLATLCYTELCLQVLDVLTCLTGQTYKFEHLGQAASQAFYNVIAVFVI